jgi:hypothetical protein
MRDPARIDKVLAVLRAAWKASPDARLCQLVLNASGARDFLGVYQTEDEDTLLGLAAMVPATAQAAPEGLVSAGSPLCVSLPCHACEGSGKVDHDPSEQPCPTCKGSGKEWVSFDDPPTPKCKACHGAGSTPVLGRRPDTCTVCRGLGRAPLTS